MAQHKGLPGHQRGLWWATCEPRPIVFPQNFEKLQDRGETEAGGIFSSR